MKINKTKSLSLSDDKTHIEFINPIKDRILYTPQAFISFISNTNIVEKFLLVIYNH